jgi:hypothetical protein
MSSNLKYEAAKALKAHIEAQIPSLVGKVYAELQPPNQQAKRPTITIAPRRAWTTIFRDPDEVFDPGVGQNYVVHDVGCYEGEFEVRLAEQHAPTREQLEQDLLDLWIKDVGRPGVLLLDLSSLTIQGQALAGYSARAPYVLDSEEWLDELIFSNERDALLTVDVRVPILVKETAYRMETLVLQLSHDVTTEDINQVPVFGQVQVNADGTVQPYP